MGINQPDVEAVEVEEEEETKAVEAEWKEEVEWKEDSRWWAATLPPPPLPPGPPPPLPPPDYPHPSLAPVSRKRKQPVACLQIVFLLYLGTSNWPW